MFWKGGGGEIAVEFLNGVGHLFYFVDFILMFTRPAPETGDVFRVCAIVPVITEDLALGSFLPRLTHNSFKNSTPVSAAGLVDPRGSQFSSWCVRVCPQTDIADIEHCFGKEEEGVSFLRSSC